MQRVRASTSDVGIAGQRPIRNWLRPSLRYDSVSTTSLARRCAASASAETDSSKSMVAVTGDRCPCWLTNGSAMSWVSAHE